jgi:hypothetical protein
MGDDIISLSIIEHYVLKYAKQFSTYVVINKKRYYIHERYSMMMSKFNKKLFDVFCRSPKIPFYYDDTDKTKYVYTSIAQLHFFKFAIEYKIIDSIRNNIDKITLHFKAYKKGTVSESFTEEELSAEFNNKVMLSDKITLDLD